MNEQFEFTEPLAETLTVIEGPAVPEVMAALFLARLAPGQLEYRRLANDGPLVAVCWRPPARLEIRVPAGDGPGPLRIRLHALRANRAKSSFSDRVRQVVARIEAWSYADSDSGSAPAEAMANDLRALDVQAPSAAARQSLRQAQDALDDGLPAEVIAAALYRVVQEADAIDARQASGLEPSPSG
ncbi:MAG TPA: hypothetical protein VIN39_04165 [Candidatus Dormibacteraeota bacterium]|jgi:hypothetical protein